MAAISIQTFEGVPDGMNLALPGQEIQDTEARYLQDILLDYPGLIRRRGPVQPASPFATFPTYKVSGIVQTLDPAGNVRLGVMRGDNSNGFCSLLSDDYTSFYDFSWPGALPTSPTTNPYRIVDSKAALTGGSWIGTSSQYDSDSPVQNLALWRGGNKADYTTGTVSITRGNTTVTGSGTSWLANASPGMFVFASTDDGYTLAYVGVILSVNSNTSITLGDVSLYNVTAKAYKLTSLRGFAPRVMKGRLTVSTSQTVVTGANTKFQTQGLNSGSWNLFRASDLAYVGKVASVTNDTSLTLSANATTAMNNDSFIAFQADADMNISTASGTKKVGFITATYAERQWYANLGTQFATTSRVWFSDPSDPEGVDLAPFDGDFINVASTTGFNSPIKALVPAYNALLVFKENETFGIFGDTPTTFSVKKVEDDGTLSGMSAQPYGGGVIWAGRKGIHFYNGIQAEDLTAGKLGDYYKNMLRSFKPSEHRMWSMIARDHYFLFMEFVQPNKPVIKGSVSTTPSSMTLVLNMVSKAITVFTNMNLRGGIQMPADSGFETLYVFNSADTGYIGHTADLFDVDGVNDSVACDGGTAGPDFYFESKKYSQGDSMHKKLFKQMAMNYLCQGDGLRFDTVLGLNEIGQTASTTFPATVYTWDSLASVFQTWDHLAANIPTWDQVILSVFAAKRIKFLKRSQNLSFRIYQNSTSVNRVRLGPFQIGFKWQRPGRI